MRLGTAWNRPTVYGWEAFVNMLSREPDSIISPAYMTATLSQVSATMPKSCVIIIMAVFMLVWSSLMSFRTWAWMVTSSAVVGSSEMSTLGEQASAMAMTTRCFIPPEN